MSRSADFSPVNPRLLMTSGVDGTIRLWDVGERRLLLTMPQAEGTEAITADFSRDGETVAMGGSHGLAALIDLGYFDRHMLGGANMVISSPAVSDTAAQPTDPAPSTSVEQLRAWAAQVESRPWPRLGTPAMRPRRQTPAGAPQ
jgi:WD40 repeat protein